MKKKTMSRFGKIIATSIATQLLFFNMTFTETARASELISKESTIIKEVPSPEVAQIGQVKEEQLVALKPAYENIPQVVQQEQTTSAATITIQPVTETTKETSVEPTTIPSTTEMTEETTELPTIETTQETEATTFVEMTTVPEIETNEESEKPFDIVNPDPDLIYFARSTIIFPKKPELKLWGVPTETPTREVLPEFTGSLVPLEAPTREALPEFVGGLVPLEVPIREALPEFVGGLVPLEAPTREALPEFVGGLVPLEAPIREVLPEFTGTIVVATTESPVTTVSTTSEAVTEVMTTRLVVTSQTETTTENILEIIQNVIENNNPVTPQEAQANEFNASSTPVPETNSESNSSSPSQAAGESPSSSGESKDSSSSSSIVPTITNLDSGKLASTVAILAVLVIAAGLVLSRV